MKILSSTGLSIPDLTNLSSPKSTDLLVIQDMDSGDNGLTKNITISQLSTAITTVFFNETFTLTNTDNVFSGSFYGTKTTIPANFYNIIARNNLTVNNNLTVSNNSSIAGSLTVGSTSAFSNNVTVSSGNVLISSGNLTVSSGTTSIQALSCGNITGTGTITGTIITATTRFAGDLRGDVYSPTGTLVLDNGSGAANQSLFYGTSSFSSKSDYVNTNGIPPGGTIGQVLSKDSGNDYDVSWGDFSGTTESEVKTIVSSSLNGEANYFAKFDSAHHITKSLGLYENAGSQGLIIQSGYSLSLSNNDLIISNGNFTLVGGDLNISDGAITSSNGFLGKNITFEETSSAVSTNQIIVYGHEFANTTLTLNANSNVTLSLNSGQTANVVVINSGTFNISEWSASFDGGVNVSDKIYWSGSIAPTIQTGAMDLYTFRNINGKVFGSAIQDFQ